MRWTQLLGVMFVGFLSMGSTCGGGDATPQSCDLAAGVCSTDADCDDGNFCNGAEHCNAGRPGADVCGCVAEPQPCLPSETCSEERDRCEYMCTDADSDGHCSIATGGGDCDDHDPNRSPARTEICDALDFDEDCDPNTYGHRDADKDGYDDSRCCNGIECGRDCDDMNAAVHPSENEVCNQLDDDCDLNVDEGVTMVAYVDSDLDGHGAKNTSTTICPNELVIGLSISDNDCNDANPAIQPGSMECNPAGSTTVRFCNSVGGFTGGKCQGQEVCFAQPNGTGICR